MVIGPKLLFPLPMRISISQAVLEEMVSEHFGQQRQKRRSIGKLCSHLTSLLSSYFTFYLLLKESFPTLSSV